MKYFPNDQIIVARFRGLRVDDKNDENIVVRCRSPREISFGCERGWGVDEQKEKSSSRAAPVRRLASFQHLHTDDSA